MTAADDARPTYPTDRRGTPIYPRDTYSPWWRRGCASIIDNALTLIIYVPVWIGHALHVGQPWSTAMYSILLVADVAFWVWNSLIRQGRSGSSLGKQWCDIQIVDTDTGQPIGAIGCLYRTLVHFVDNIALGLGWLWPLWGRRRRTFADMIARTIAVPAHDTTVVAAYR
ncbi:RDD family protein [Williamsia sterculiae]|uniref:Uncharacterized membrane protein YckC, RDD family n=1 Tax=Williamsia sterculiae TaxID=1344003 RepID=A0A1N7GE67_9NOCA|nr:RDD family protein [Williamsia sterculiae]SIS10915.1 Uncharacterized membrane protein YckC, RDD family [Williamsia sterculiae]